MLTFKTILRNKIVLAYDHEQLSVYFNFITEQCINSILIKQILGNCLTLFNLNTNVRHYYRFCFDLDFLDIINFIV